MNARINTAYKRSSDGYVQKLCDRVNESLKDNPKFPEANERRTKLEQVAGEFRTAVSIAGRSDRTLSSAKNDKKAELIAILNDIAAYVITTSNGDKTMLLSSGFDIIGLKSESQELTPITALIVTIGDPGQATTKVTKVTGAKSYVHQYTQDPITPESVWVSETVTDRQHTFNGLQSVTRYWFRVIAIGKGRQSVYSPPVSRVIQ